MFLTKVPDKGSDGPKHSTLLYGIKVLCLMVYFLCID